MYTNDVIWGVSYPDLYQHLDLIGYDSRCCLRYIISLGFGIKVCSAHVQRPDQTYIDGNGGDM